MPSRENALPIQPFFPERVAEARRLLQFVTSRLAAQHNDILYLCGNCGCGKTSTAQQLMQVDFSASTSGARAPVFSLVNCADLSALDIATRLVHALQGTRHKVNTGAKVSLAELRSRLREAVTTPRRLDRLCVLILDEVEAARPAGITEIRKFCDLALEFGSSSVAIIIISNSKDLFNVNPRRLQSVTFQPYSAAQLVAIAKRDPSSAVIESSALQFAAKSCTATYHGDVRKMQSFCAIAKDAAVHSKQSATAIDIRNGICDTPNTNVPGIKALPQQMLFVLCCCYKVHCDIRAHLSLPTLSVSKIYMSYESSCRKIGMAPASVSEVRSCLANLVDLGLLTAGRGGREELYSVAVHESELREALTGDSNVLALARTASGLEVVNCRQTNQP